MNMIPYLFFILLLIISLPCTANELDWIRISDDGKHFIHAGDNKPYVPWGFNYDHDRDGQLLEDYWHDWNTIEQDFAEMKQLGANVVRIHLQFGKFMRSPTEANQPSLDKLAKLVKLAEQTGLYLDLTGLACYHKQDVPPWYDQLDEQQRWAAQAVFWEAVAKTCAKSPAIFCYDLMNEPVVPGNKQRDDWLAGPFHDKYFVQFISLNANKRPREQIARKWIQTLVAAIRKHAKRHLVTVGMVHWSLKRPGLYSGFDPKITAPELDFLAVHLYPKQENPEEAIETLAGFAAFGKPVVIEETFPLKCNVQTHADFIKQSKQHAVGWIGFYWGKTPDQYRPAKNFAEAATLGWLETFQVEREFMTQLQSKPQE